MSDFLNQIDYEAIARAQRAQGASEEQVEITRRTIRERLSEVNLGDMIKQCFYWCIAAFQSLWSGGEKATQSDSLMDGVTRFAGGAGDAGNSAALATENYALHDKAHEIYESLRRQCIPDSLAQLATGIAPGQGSIGASDPAMSPGLLAQYGRYLHANGIEPPPLSLNARARKLRSDSLSQTT